MSEKAAQLYPEIAKKSFDKSIEFHTHYLIDKYLPAKKQNLADKILRVSGQLIEGYMSAYTGGIMDYFIHNEPETLLEKLSHGVGEAIGFINGIPLKLAREGVTYAAKQYVKNKFDKELKQIQANFGFNIVDKAINILAKHPTIIKEMSTLGIANAIANNTEGILNSDKSAIDKLKDNLKARFNDFFIGTITGGRYNLIPELET